MKTIVLLLVMTLPQIAGSKVVVPPYVPKPIIFVDENGEKWIFYPPLESGEDGSAKL